MSEYRFSLQDVEHVYREFLLSYDGDKVPAAMLRAAVLFGANWNGQGPYPDSADCDRASAERFAAMLIQGAQSSSRTSHDPSA